MDVQINIQDRSVTCICLKDIDVYSERHMRDEILHSLPLPGEYDDFILDINKITYLDSTGIGMMVFFLNYMNKKGKSFALTGVQPTVLKILKRNKLDNIITII